MFFKKNKYRSSLQVNLSYLDSEWNDYENNQFKKNYIAANNINYDESVLMTQNYQEMKMDRYIGSNGKNENNVQPKSPILRGSHLKPLVEVQNSNTFLNSQVLSDSSLSKSIHFHSPIQCSTYNKYEFDSYDSRDHKLKPKNNHLNSLSTPRKNKILKNNKPIIKQIEPCFFVINSINESNNVNNSKNIQQVSMDLTKIQNNCILNKSKCKSIVPDILDATINSTRNDLVDNCFNSKNLSMLVNTSTNNKKNNIDESNVNNQNYFKINEIDIYQNKNMNASESKVNNAPLLEHINRVYEKVCIIPSSSVKLNEDINENTDKINRKKVKSSINCDEMNTLRLPGCTVSQSHSIIQESFEEENTPLNSLSVIEKLKINKKKKLFTHQNSPSSISLTPLLSDVSTSKIAKSKKIEKKKIIRNISGNVVRKIEEKNLKRVSPQLTITSSSWNSYDTDNDEKFHKKNDKIKRIVKRKNISNKKEPVFHNNLLKLSNKSVKIPKKTDIENLDNDLKNNDSTDDFIDVQTYFTMRQKYNKHKSRIIIVTSGLSDNDKNYVKNVVDSIGAAIIEIKVTKHTTHIVTNGKKMKNLYLGIIRGCHIVTLNWILDSFKFHQWLPETNYEIQEFSKTVKENRQERRIFGDCYVPELFASCGFICIEKNTLIPAKLLKELIKTAGGSINESSQSKIIIGPDGLKESWVLDSIVNGELQDVKKYRR